MQTRNGQVLICASLLFVVLGMASCGTTPGATPAAPGTGSVTPSPEVAVGPSVSPEDVPRIGIEELKALMDSGADVVVVDNRPRVAYDQGHIKGALNLPYTAELREEEVAMLSRDKLIVTYCDCGPGEADSASVAAQLIKMGFSNVKVLADPSIVGWIQAGYPVE